MDRGGRLPGSVKAAAGLPVARAPTAVAGPQLLVGERSPRWLRAARRSAVSVPLGQRLPRRIGTWLALAFLGASAAAGMSVGGQVETLRHDLGEPRHVLARMVGFGVDRVTISGIAELSEIEVLITAGIDPKVSLPFFDAEEARRRLEAAPLIRQATIRKLYPGEISITLTEREPYALWQLRGELFVIAADGTVIDRMDDGRFAHLPLVVGEGANTRAREYLDLLREAGPLAPRVRAGSLVAGRRWTLKLEGGVEVRLPEDEPAAAVKRLIALESDVRLLEKDILAIDLRQPDRVALRLTEEGAGARAVQLKTKGKKNGGEA